MIDSPSSEATVQREAVEDVHGLLQLSAGGGACGGEDFLLPRGSLSGSALAGADPRGRPSGGCARQRPRLRSPVGRSQQGTRSYLRISEAD